MLVRVIPGEMGTPRWFLGVFEEFRAFAILIISLFMSFAQVSADIDCEYSYTSIYGKRTTLKFECDNWDYCCGQSCCHSSSHFFRLWYFWFVIILILFMCMASGYWWRRRMLRQSMMGQAVIVTSHGGPYTGVNGHPYPVQPVVTYHVANPYTPYGPGVRGETVTIGGNPTYPTYNYQPSQPPHSGAGQSAPAPPPAYNELYK